VFGRIERNDEQRDGAQELENEKCADEQKCGGRFAETENYSGDDGAISAGENDGRKIFCRHDGIHPAFFDDDSFSLLDVLQYKKEKSEHEHEQAKGKEEFFPMFFVFQEGVPVFQCEVICVENSE